MANDYMHAYSYSSILAAVGSYSGAVFCFFQAWEGLPFGKGWKVISHSRALLVFNVKLDARRQIMNLLDCSWSMARFARSLPDFKHSCA